MSQIPKLLYTYVWIKLKCEYVDIKHFLKTKQQMSMSSMSTAILYKMTTEMYCLLKKWNRKMLWGGEERWDETKTMAGRSWNCETLYWKQDRSE